MNFAELAKEINPRTGFHTTFMKPHGVAVGYTPLPEERAAADAYQSVVWEYTEEAELLEVEPQEAAEQSVLLAAARAHSVLEAIELEGQAQDDLPAPVDFETALEEAALESDLDAKHSPVFETGEYKSSAIKLALSTTTRKLSHDRTRRVQGQGQGGKRHISSNLGGDPALLLLSPVALLVKCASGIAMVVVQCSVLRRVVPREVHHAGIIFPASLTKAELAEPKTEVTGQALNLCQDGHFFRWHGIMQENTVTVKALGRFVTPLSPKLFPASNPSHSSDASEGPACSVGFEFEGEALQSIHEQLLQDHADANEPVMQEVVRSVAGFPYTGSDGRPVFFKRAESQEPGGARHVLITAPAASDYVECGVTGCGARMKVNEIDGIADGCQLLSGTVLLLLSHRSALLVS